MTNAQIAKKLRAVAKRAEEAESAVPATSEFMFVRAGNFFTCTEVAKEFGPDTAKGRAMSSAYRDVMLDSEDELWHDPDIASIRVLLVCFAAALAETGDLLPA